MTIVSMNSSVAVRRHRIRPWCIQRQSALSACKDFEVSDSATSSPGHPATSILLACYLLQKKDSGVLPGKKSDILKGGADDSAKLCLSFLETTCIK